MNKLNTIKELAKVSTYRPQKGAKLELFHLTAEKGLSRKDAKKKFEDTNRLSQFRTIYKRLKDSLLTGVIDHNFPNLSKEKKTRFNIWKKHLQCKMLINAFKKDIGVKLATETISLAEKNDELDVVQSLCKELIKYYSIISPNTTNYYKYRSKLHEVNEKIFITNEAELLYRELVFCHQKKWSINHLEEEIRLLINKGEIVDHYNYRYYYYSIIRVYAQLTNQSTLHRENSKKAISYFDSCSDDISYLPKFQFLMELVPGYIQNQEFAKAETTINACCNIPPKGVPNWQISRYYLAILGFYSDKPSISKLAYNSILNIPKKLLTEGLTEKWKFVYAYLSFFGKVGKIDFESNLKLYRFLNTFDERQKDIPQKINLLIIELIHLICDGNKIKFMNKCEQLDSFIIRNLRSNQYIRTKYFLKLLKCVEKGDYNKERVLAHAKRPFASLLAAKPVQTSLRFDFELIPYELLWEEVIGMLRDKN